MAYQSIFQNPGQVVNPKRDPTAALPQLRQPGQQPGVSTLPAQPAATPQAGQISMQEFAQSIKKKYPTYANQDDTKLATAFLQKYPQYADKVAGASSIVPQTAGGEPYEEPGFFKSLGQGIAKPFLKTAATVAQLGQGVGNLAQAVGSKITGDQAGYQRNIQEGMAATDPNREFNFGALGQGIKGVQLQPGQGTVSQFLPTAQSALDVAGTGAELGSFFTGGGVAKNTAKQAFQNKLLQSAYTGLKGGAGSGAVAGLGMSLQDQERLGLGNTLLQTGLGALTGGAGGAVFGAGSTLLGRGLNKLTGKPLPPKPSSAEFFRSGAGKALMGDDVAQATARLADDPANVQAFRTGQKTFETIANTTKKAVDALETKSKNFFEAIKSQALTGKKFPKVATQKGVLTGLPRASELTPQEKPIITKLRNLVMNNKDWTDNGLWALRNRIDRAGLFRESPDYVSSNRAVTNARNFLNGKITEGNPAMKQALEDATTDIDLLGKLQASLIGRNADTYVERTATKLNTLMNKLDDPTQYEATRKLVQELEDRTGIAIMPDLEAAHAASVIKNKTEFPGIEKPTQSLGNLIRKGVLGRVQKGAETRQSQVNAQKVYDIRQQINQAGRTEPGQEIAQRAYDLTKKNGGVTINLDGDVPVTGFVVAPSKGTEFKIPQGQIKTSDLQKYIRNYFEQLQHPNAHLGTWVDGDQVVLDVSHVYDDPLKAVNIAKAGQQDAIFNLDNFESVYAKDFSKLMKKGKK